MRLRLPFFLLLETVLLALPLPTRAQPYVASISGDNPCAAGWAEFPRVDPRNPDIICLPELGRMEGDITTSLGAGNGERYWN